MREGTYRVWNNVRYTTGTDSEIERERDEDIQEEQGCTKERREGERE